jgi:hypothetical protein
LGFLLVLLGGFGFMTFWFDTKKEKQETQEWTQNSKWNFLIMAKPLEYLKETLKI